MVSLVTVRRQARGWTISELARRADMPRCTIYAAERGRGTSLATQIRLAQALGYPLREVFPEAAPLVEAAI